MIKYTVIDTHLKFIDQPRAEGRAQAGLQVRGTAAATASGGVAGSGAATTIPTNARTSQKYCRVFPEWGTDT